MAAMEEYILMAVPEESPAGDTLRLINDKTSGISTNYVLPLPDVKIGSLDMLMNTSEKLVKDDTFATSVVQKMMEYLQSLLGPEDREQLLVGPSRVPMETFIQTFQWDAARYPLRLQLGSVLEVINKVISQTEATFKQKVGAHNALVQKVQAAEKKSTGNLMTRSLDELVSVDKLVLDSEYLETLLVVVPKTLSKEWLGCYETITAMVVPRSSEVVAEDADFYLYTVTLFKKVIEDFKSQALLHKFVVRDYKFSTGGQEQALHERRQLEMQLKKLLGPTIHWLKANFNVVFSAWIHLKCLRILVESVLRYGLSNKLVAIAMKPHSKTKLKRTLDSMFAHLDMKFVLSKAYKDEEVGGIAGQHIESEYHPFVMFVAHIPSSPSQHTTQPRRGSRQLQQTLDVVMEQDGGTCVRMPGQVAGRPFVIQKCRNSTIVILDCVARVTIQECTNCKIFVAACKERVLLDDCVDCHLFAATRQMLARWCVHCEAHLLCSSPPLLRSSVDMMFGCLQCSFPQLKGHLDTAGLSVFTNLWSYVSDTSKEDDEKSTWSLCPPESTASLELRGRDLLGGVTMSFSKDTSLIPHTTGPQQKPPGEECMVAFFCQSENSRQKAFQFLRQLKLPSSGSPILLVQTLESTFRPEEVRWLSHHPLFSPQGTCVIAEVYGEGSVERCRGLLAGLGVEAYMSKSPQQAGADVESFMQCIATKLAMFKRQNKTNMADNMDSESIISQPM